MRSSTFFGNTAETGNNIQTDGLVAYWDAAYKKSYVSGSTTTYNLASGSLTPNGTLTNGTAFITQPISASCWDFDGVDDFIDLGSDTSLEPVSSLSVSAWIKRDASMVNYSGIVQSQKTNYIHGWVMVGTSANKVRFYLDTSAGWKYAEIDSAITIDTWYHILGTWDGDTIRLYVNGVLQSMTTAAADIDYPASPNENAKIGQYALKEFPGNIANCQIYNRSLSTGDVLQNFNAQKERFGY